MDGSNLQPNESNSPVKVTWLLALSKVAWVSLTQPILPLTMLLGQGSQQRAISSGK
jgi:hypothetical protein